jgi:hypothetical protein
VTDQTQPEAGWYPDPSGSPNLRWWSGRAWSDDTHPLLPAEPSLGYVVPPTEPAPVIGTALASDGATDPGPRHRVLGVAVIAVSVCVVTALTVALGVALTSRNKLDTTAVERRIAQSLSDQTGSTMQVDCPSDVSLERGANFRCVATASDRTTALVDVHQDDDQGNVTWRIVRSG